jgi:hypothetical protein
LVLALVQKWCNQNEVMILHNKKNSKNYHTKSVTFQTHSNKSCPKKVSVFFVIEIRRNCEF